MNEEERKNETEIVDIDEEINWKEVLKPYMQPYVLIFIVCVLLMVIAAFYLGYQRGYEHCLIACSEKIQNMSVFA